MWIRRSLIVLTVVVAACKPKEQLPAAGPDASAAPAAPAEASRILAADQSYTMNLPGRWAGFTRTDSLSTAERGLALPGAVNIVYIPRDTAIIPQTLVVIAVYDSASWVKARSAGGPPPGDSVASGNGRVYIVGMPQSNPFTPGSVDALKFDSLSLRPDEKAGIVSVGIKK